MTKRYMAEKDMDCSLDNIVESFSQREQGNDYRCEIKKKYSVFQIDEDMIIAEIISNNQDWKSTRMIDAMCGEGYRFARMLASIEKLFGIKTAGHDAKFEVLQSLGKLPDEEVFAAVSNRFDITGIDGCDRMIDSARETGVYKRLVHTKIPAPYLGLDRQDQFTYGFINSCSIGNVCGRDGDENRIAVLRAFKNLIRPDGYIFMDTYCLDADAGDSGREPGDNILVKTTPKNEKNPSFLRLLSCDEVLSYAKAAGLKVEKMTAIALAEKNRVFDVYDREKNQADVSIINKYEHVFVQNVLRPEKV
jgi:hypothetical protein